MFPPEIYPWQQVAWNALNVNRLRLPHALLVSGLPGTGKEAFVTRLAGSLLCLAPADDGSPCMGCKSCRLLATGSHPDLVVIQPEEEATAIVVDQIRGVIEFLTLRPHTSSKKVVLLGPAEKMNLNASNSLLKALEEPPADSQLLLYTSMANALPATIRSRCSQVRLNPPATEDGLTWLTQNGLDPTIADDLLAAANGAPLMALSMAAQGFPQQRQMMMEDLLKLRKKGGDPVECAVRWKAAGTRSCLQWFSGLVADMIQQLMVKDGAARLNNPSFRQPITELAANSAIGRLLALLDSTMDAIRMSDTPLDDSLLIEDILIRWNKTAVK